MSECQWGRVGCVGRRLRSPARSRSSGPVASRVLTRPRASDPKQHHHDLSLCPRFLCAGRGDNPGRPVCALVRDSRSLAYLGRWQTALTTYDAQRALIRLHGRHHRPAPSTHRQGIPGKRSLFFAAFWTSPTWPGNPQACAVEQSRCRLLLSDKHTTPAFLGSSSLGTSAPLLALMHIKLTYFLFKRHRLQPGWTRALCKMR